MGLTFVPITLLATGGVDSDDAGLASGLFNTSQQVGGSLGLALLSTLAASRTTSLLPRRRDASRAAQRVRLPRRVRDRRPGCWSPAAVILVRRAAPAARRAALELEPAPIVAAA